MPELPQIGDVIGRVEVPVTRETAVRYAGASTDFNPIHYSDAAARAVGLDGVIVHGMWTMGAALGVVTAWAGGPERLRSYSARFTRPVPIPDDLTGSVVTFEATVSAVADGIVTIDIGAECGGEKVLGAARAEVAL